MNSANLNRLFAGQNQRLFAAMLVSLVWLWSTSSVARAGTIDGITTPAVNNDDYNGTFPGPNFQSTLNLTGFDSDIVRSVTPSGGTTEYSLRLSAALTAPTNAIHIELGFGTGTSFVSAASVVPNLDFDAPLPGVPAPSSTVFPVVHAQPYLIEYSGSTASGTIFEIADFELDVPDFPASITSFTLRERTGPAVPEPASIILTALALPGLAFAAARRRGR